jgi:hypothetical protein
MHFRGAARRRINPRPPSVFSPTDLVICPAAVNEKVNHEKVNQSCPNAPGASSTVHDPRHSQDELSPLQPASVTARYALTAPKLIQTCTPLHAVRPPTRPAQPARQCRSPGPPRPLIASPPAHARPHSPVPLKSPRYYWLVTMEDACKIRQGPRHISRTRIVETV